MGSEPASSMLRINGIIRESIVDGPGLRYVIFVQGCPHHCPGCHNPQTHSFSDGHMESIDDIFEEYRKNPLLAGITFSGGEPFCQCKALAELGRRVRDYGGNVISYTGYLYEDLLERSRTDPYIHELLEVTDLLIDGPYKEELRSLDLAFRGSSNQRLLFLSGRIPREGLL